MKHIFKSIVALLCGTMAISSCLQEGKPLASAVKVDKAEVVLEGQNVQPEKVNVEADGDWFAIAPKWVKVEPSTGSGNMEVVISATENIDEWKELAGPRSGIVTFCYGTTGAAPVIVNQKGENGLDTSREFKKVAKTEEVTEGAYLIVFNTGELLASKPFNASDEKRYEYLQTEGVKDEKGVIAMPNAANAFAFEKAEGGFYIKMSNGRYLFQDSSHNNFYSTTDKAKAFVWTVAVNEDGTAKIMSTPRGSFFQYSVKYTSVGAYDAAQDNAVMPILYKDAKPATDEVLVVPESLSVTAESVEAVIKVQSNKTWKVRCHDDWIKSFTKEGTGDGEIKLTFDANTSKTDAKVASIQVIGETTNYVVKFTQNKVATTLAEVVDMITSTNKSAQSAFSAEVDPAKPAVVTYVNGKKAYVEDGTAGLFIYASENVAYKVGDKLSGKITGNGYVYSKLPQATTFTAENVEAGQPVKPTEVTLEELHKNYTKFISRFVIIKGVEVIDGIEAAAKDRSGKIKQGKKDIAVRDQTKKTVLTLNAKGDIIGFPAVYNKDRQLAFWETAHFTEAK